METAVVFDVQKFSVHDGPGIRTLLFLKGCGLRCKWCANPESQSERSELMLYPKKCIGDGNCVRKCPTGAVYIDGEGHMRFDRSKCVGCGTCAEACYAKARVLSGRVWTVEEAIKEVDKDMVFYKNSGGGITFSGGEALLYPRFVRDVAKHYHEQGISTAIETCGEVPYGNFEEIIPYMDLFLFDLKTMDEEKHIKYTGRSNKRILQNLQKVSQQSTTVVRIPIIPGINDSDKDIDEFGTFLSGMSDRIKNINILPYHDLGKSKYDALEREYLLPDIKAPSAEHMAHIKERLEGFGFNVKIGG